MVAVAWVVAGWLLLLLRLLVVVGVVCRLFIVILCFLSFVCLFLYPSLPLARVFFSATASVVFLLSACDSCSVLLPLFFLRSLEI